MRRVALRVVSVLVLSSCAAPSRTAHPPVASSSAGFDAPDSGAIELVRSLSDEVGPRLAGSPGDALAVAWAQRTMTSLGLANVHTEAARVTHWERGVERGAITSPVAQTVALTALGGSVPTAPEGLEAELVEAPSLEALDARSDERVRGRIVYLHAVMRRAVDGAGYGEAVSARTRGAIAAARKGAVAVLVRSIGTDSSRAPHTGQMRYDDAVTRIPAAALSTADGDMVHRTLARNTGPVRFRLTLGCRALPEADSANVVGEVPGTDRAQEVVLLGAHLDSWDLGTGALDDGAGVSIVLSTARALLTSRPRRTVRVVLFANEENGLGGGRAYAQAHADELARHVAALEADAGDGHVLRVRWAGDPAHHGLFDTLASRLAPFGIARDDEPAHGGADVSPLGERGVPRVDLVQEMARYFDHHHTANDTPAVVDARELDRAVAAWTVAVRTLADADTDLGRAPPPTH